MIVVLIIILLIIFIYFTYNKETFGDLRDTLDVPDAPRIGIVNESQGSANIRLLNITKYLAMDKFDRVDRLSVKKPLPRTGQIVCYRITCPAWITKAACFACE